MSNTTEPLDFNIDLTEVKVAYPSLAVGKHKATITKMERVAWRDKPDKSSLVVEMTLAEPAHDTKGNAVNPGYVFRHRIALQQSDNERAPDFRRDLATLIDAVEGTSDKTGRPPFTGAWCESAIGKLVEVEFKVAKDPQYGETEVKTLRHPIQ